MIQLIEFPKIYFSNPNN